MTFDSYMSPRMLGRWEYRLLRALLGVSLGGDRPALDETAFAIMLRHVRGAGGVDRVVALAFDEYHSDGGERVSAFDPCGRPYSDLYVSNTFVHGLCRAHPEHLLFGASIHPYRRDGSRTALEMLDEVADAGAVLIKWLPLVQNIRADDGRTVEFLRRAAQLHMPLLIHYGGERALTTNHPELTDPRPLLATLRSLRAEGASPLVVIAHFATPSAWPMGPHNFFDVTADALLGEFADAPLYCDTSAMGLFTRARWLKRILRRPELHHKLVHGSDFPIPVNPIFFLRQLRTGVIRLWRVPSWIGRDYALKLALGLGDDVMMRSWDILREGLARRMGPDIALHTGRRGG